MLIQQPTYPLQFDMKRSPSTGYAFMPKFLLILPCKSYLFLTHIGRRWSIILFFRERLICLGRRVSESPLHFDRHIKVILQETVVVEEEVVCIAILKDHRSLLYRHPYAIRTLYPS